jgi:reductive dehalogenase
LPYNPIFEEEQITMQNFAVTLFLISLFIFGVILVLFVVYSYIENERKALGRGIITVAIFGVFLFGISFLPEQIYAWLSIIPIVSILVVTPKYGNKKIVFKLPEKRFDERDVMFSRNTLKENTEKFEAYYRMHPENKAADDAFRQEPGLMAKGTTFYNEMLFNAAHATFETVNLLQPLVEQPASNTKTSISQSKISDFIKNWTIKMGAVDVGFTSLKPHHVYTHIGRGTEYGNEVTLDHKFAIAFTVEMNYNSMIYNPKGPVIMESAQQYFNAGQIAVQLAQFLRSLGFEARAHIDANYRLICPIVAQDAGLGTIGRMGLLMTPKLGPRVRIGVVSTNFELPENTQQIDYSMIHFCNVCKKCATNCPSQSITNHSVSNNDNPERWTIDHEKCFTFWCKVGTDCGRCVSVCPYSHPDNFIHNIIRWMIKRNPVNRWFSLILDDFFYGKKPSANKLKDWMLPRNN